MDQFATAFGDADTLQVLDIYAASEQPIEGVTAEHLVNEILHAGHPAVRYTPAFDEAAQRVSAEAKEGDLILTLGAGNVYQVGPMILQKLQAAQTIAATP
jgi:UDP-N-acetylmuramate--alanine ligase